jgi:hypothetical protein
VSDYEIRVAGPVGPVVASIFPEFTATAIAASTLLSGTVADAEDLLAVMTLLSAHGLTPIDTLITPHDTDEPVLASDPSRQQERSSDT